jgi:hypothetical protein
MSCNQLEDVIRLRTTIVEWVVHIVITKNIVDEVSLTCNHTEQHGVGRDEC